MIDTDKNITLNTAQSVFTVVFITPDHCCSGHCKAIQRNPVSTKNLAQNLKRLNYNTNAKKRSFPHYQLNYKTKQIQSVYDAEEEKNITPCRGSVESKSRHLWRYASSQRSPEFFSDLKKKKEKTHINQARIYILVITIFTQTVTLLCLYYTT